MEELLRYIVEELIDSHDEIEINKRIGHHSITLDLRVPADEAGKIIGRNGRVVNACPLMKPARLLDAMAAS
jgi:uncharacterized protein